MLNKKQENLWVMRLLTGYLSHPRGTITQDLDEAYGWHYKKLAKSCSSEYQNSIIKRRKDFRTA